MTTRTDTPVYETDYEIAGPLALKEIHFNGNHVEMRITDSKSEVIHKVIVSKGDRTVDVLKVFVNAVNRLEKERL